MKRLLDLLGSLWRAWPLLVIIAGAVLSGLAWIGKWGRTSIEISIPISLVLLIGALALYPILKLAHYSLKRMRAPVFDYKGLKWRPAFLSFRYPTPLCPKPECGREIFCRMIPPPPIQAAWGLDEIKRLKTRYSYEYECPLHGKVQGVPNVSIDELQEKARLVIKP